MIHKGYIIKNHPKTPPLKIVVTEGRGGKIPAELSGMYTTETLARDAIDKYVHKKERKGAKAKTVSSAKQPK